jgi:hypothetical protein
MVEDDHLSKDVSPCCARSPSLPLLISPESSPGSHSLTDCNGGKCYHVHTVPVVRYVLVYPYARYMCLLLYAILMRAEDIKEEKGREQGQEPDAELQQGDQAAPRDRGGCACLAVPPPSFHHYDYDWATSIADCAMLPFTWYLLPQPGRRGGRTALVHCLKN